MSSPTRFSRRLERKRLDSDSDVSNRSPSPTKKPAKKKSKRIKAEGDGNETHLPSSKLLENVSPPDTISKDNSQLSEPSKKKNSAKKSEKATEEVEVVQEEQVKEPDYKYLQDDSPYFMKVDIENSEDFVCFAYWDSSSKPKREDVEFSWKSEKDKYKKMVATHKYNHKVTYVGSKMKNLEKEFHFLDTDDNGNSIMKPIVLFRIRPLVELDETLAEELTKEERYEELNSKFGSKKQNRALKQRMATSHLEFKGDEVDDLVVAGIEQQESNPSSPASQPLKKEDVRVVPKRNDEATRKQDVYNLEDVIPKDHQESVVKLFKKNSFQKESIDFSYFRKRFELQKDETKQMMSVYGGLLFQLLMLDRSNLNVEDPIKTEADDGITSCKVLEMYATIAKDDRMKGFKKWTLSQKEKDILASRIMLIIFFLEDYKPLRCDLLTKALNLGKPKIKDIAFALGFHLEKTKDKSKKQVDELVMKIPIYIPKKVKRGRGRGR